MSDPIKDYIQAMTEFFENQNKPWYRRRWYGAERWILRHAAAVRFLVFCVIGMVIGWLMGLIL